MSELNELKRTSDLERAVVKNVKMFDIFPPLWNGDVLEPRSVVGKKWEVTKMATADKPSYFSGPRHKRKK